MLFMDPIKRLNLINLPIESNGKERSFKNLNPFPAKVSGNYNRNFDS